MSQFDLTGKVAIITGSSRGIGKASAYELAEHGAKVVISSRKQDVCDAVAAAIIRISFFMMDSMLIELRSAQRQPR